jgi:RNA polymerase sigma factor (sigma-70 family)
LLLTDGAGLTDGQLLDDYLGHRDEAALAALMHRHGPMVWGVCRRVLHDYHDAEDAFQATFLVFVRKAASIASRELLANWLYGVARQTALKARATATRRKERERQVTKMPEPAAAEQDLWCDLQPLLDEELGRLPDKYRAVLVLCDLQGKTRKEVAHLLGCPEGTVAGRLARARTALAKRLTRRGVSLSVGTLAAVLSQKVASAGVPNSVLSSTIKSANLFAAGRAAGVVSAKVTALTEGVLKTMLLMNLKTVVAVLLVIAMVSVGAGLIGYGMAGGQESQGKKPDEAAPQKGPAKSNEAGMGWHLQQAVWVLTKVDAGRRTVSVRSQPTGPALNPKVNNGRLRLPMDGVSLHALPVAKGAKFQLDGKEAKLPQLKAGMRLSLTTAKTSLMITGIKATSPAPDARYTVKEVDALRNTVTVTVGKDGPTLEALPVAKDAEIQAEWLNIKLGAFESQKRKLSALRGGMSVRLTITLEGGKLLVKAIQFSE